MKIIRPVLAATAALALLLVGASPAMAIIPIGPAGPVSILPSTQSLYAITCNTVYNDDQLLRVDPTSAFSTAIGTGTGTSIEGCGYQPAYNPVTGTAYYLRGYGVTLATINLTTGVSTNIGDFSLGGSMAPQVASMAIGLDGSAYAIAGSKLYSLNLATAELTLIGATSLAWGFAVDPTTGDFYSITTDGTVYRVDVADGSTEEVAWVFLEGTEGWDGIFSLQIDSAGVFWIQSDQDNDGAPGPAVLFNFVLPATDSAFAPSFVGYFTDDPYYTRAILIAPAPAPVLAKTGLDLAGTSLIAGFAALVAAAGAMLVVRRRRTT